MPQPRARRGSSDSFDFEGVGDEARHWLDTAYGADLGLRGSMGTVRHRRLDKDGAAFDHLQIDSPVTFAAEPMPAIVVVDVIGGEIEYSRGRRTDRGRGGDTVLAAGWGQPFTGSGNGYEVRNTSISLDVLATAIREVDPEMTEADLVFRSYVPVSAAAGARWRATVDELAASFPDVGTIAHGEASRLLGHTLLHTFANNVVEERRGSREARDRRDASQATLRRAQAVVEERCHDDLSLADLAEACGVSPRALQYAFRQHLGCTPLGYVKQVRLDLAHQALSDGSGTSVSDVAARLGFFNPGRFASEYRQVFEENPGQTLTRTS